MTNVYSIFLQRDSEKIRLPINPEKLPEQRETDNGEYNVLGVGPIMIPRIPKLKTVTISSYFPGRKPYGISLWDGFHEPDYYIQFIEKAMQEKAVILYLPVRIYENGERYGVSLTGFDALVTSFSYEERGGETGDFYYTLTLTEYRNYAPNVVTMSQSADNEQTSTATAVTEPSRSIPAGQLVVGATVQANGPYYYTSYGDEPHGTSNGQQLKVSRIVDGTRAYPIHVTTLDGGPLGWMKKEALQVVSV